MKIVFNTDLFTFGIVTKEDGLYFYLFLIGLKFSVAAIPPETQKAMDELANAIREENMRYQNAPTLLELRTQHREEEKRRYEKERDEQIKQHRIGIRRQLITTISLEILHRNEFMQYDEIVEKATYMANHIMEASNEDKGR